MDGHGDLELPENLQCQQSLQNAHARQQLVLKGVDTVATLVLNGKEAGQMSSAHRFVLHYPSCCQCTVSR